MTDAVPFELPALCSTQTSDIAACCALDEEARAIVPDEPTARGFLHRLLSEGRWTDAVHFLAHGLCVEDGVCWARECAAYVEVTHAERAERSFAIIDAWLGAKDPDERRERREEAAQAAEASGHRDPVDWALVAIANSEAPVGADRPELYPLVAGRAVAAAILLAATRGNETIVQDHDDLFVELLQTFLSYGVDRAAGGAGVMDPDRMAAYAAADDPLDGQTKLRVLHLAELAGGRSNDV
jgi:hypothetical protein